MENAYKDTAKMIIRFFNMQTGQANRSGSDTNPTSNINLALSALKNYSVAEVKDHIRVYAANTPNGEASYKDCMFSILDKKTGAEVQPEVKPEVTETQVQYSMGILEQAVVNLISQTQAGKIEAEIMGQVEGKVRAFIEQEYGAIERKITTVIDGKKVPMQGIQHDKFETVLQFVANDEPVFLTGPAGSGKNVLCKQVAEALGLKFYFTNAVTQEYKITGFTDAMGNYQPTQFYKAFTQGGLFMLDEMDASIPDVLNVLNAAIANRYFDFPAPVGYVEAHPDFRVIAAGNTFGTGASYEYVGRNQLDAASLDRFAIVKIGYSEEIENAVAGDMELARFCRELRRNAEAAGQQVIVSYRAIGRLAKMSQIMDLDEAIETCVTKGMEKDDLNVIYNGLSESKFKAALKVVINRI